MKIVGLIWLDEVVDKIAVKHGVAADEVEEVFARKPRFRKMERGHFQGEDVFRALGRSSAGRYLTVFFILKLNHKALILSARDMDSKERKTYAKK